LRHSLLRDTEILSNHELAAAAWAGSQTQANTHIRMAKRAKKAKTLSAQKSPDMSGPMV
jgi:hypothetical protein